MWSNKISGSGSGSGGGGGGCCGTGTGTGTGRRGSESALRLYAPCRLAQLIELGLTFPEFFGERSEGRGGTLTGWSDLQLDRDLALAHDFPGVSGGRGT